jgi:peptide-methionine (R)-S-oxide reductase
MGARHDDLHEDGRGCTNLTRRRLMCGAAASLGAIGTLALFKDPEGTARAAPSLVQIEGFSPSGQSQGVSQLPKIVRTEAQWREQLSAQSFDVTRRAGTEVPYTGALWNQHAAGLYSCVCCQTSLFDSRTKFESGTGWPSFWQPISKYNVIESPDNSLFMRRTEVTCANCGGHLGHVFPDGPNGCDRYCINSVSLKLDPADQAE